MIHSKRNLENRKVVYGYATASLIILALIIAFLDKLKLIFTNPAVAKEFIVGFGPLAPFMIILLLALQVLVFVIPGPVFIMAAGFAYGAVMGGMLSLVGIMIGSIFVFFLSRRYGRPFVTNIVHRKELEHFDAYFRKRGKITLFITRAIPVLFPIDAVSFAAGLTSISYKDYIIMSFLGFVPHVFLLTFFGERLSSGIDTVSVAIMAVLTIGILAYLFRHRLKVLLIKEIHDFEKELKITEEKAEAGARVIEKGIGNDYQKIIDEIASAEKRLVLGKKIGK